MIKWKDFVLKQEKAKELKIDIKEPDERYCVYVYCFMHFSGFCNKEEIKQITDIVYQAYLRNKENKDE